MQKRRQEIQFVLRQGENIMEVTTQKTTWEAHGKHGAEVTRSLSESGLDDACEQIGNQTGTCCWLQRSSSSVFPKEVLNNALFFD